MNRSIVLIGGGGHCKSVINVAESAGFRILGILDTAEHIEGKGSLRATITFLSNLWIASARYDIETATDIQDALTDLLSGTIKGMMEAEKYSSRVERS